MLERSSKASKELAMSPLAKLRVSTLACALFFSISTAAQPALAEVLISVNKSTQQMSVSVDGVPRYRFAVSTGRAGYGTPNGTYHPQRLAFSMAVTQFMAATRSTGLAGPLLTAASACTRQTPQLFSHW
jgi:hypothetical protein